jgi:hypothetical protein
MPRTKAQDKVDQAKLDENKQKEFDAAVEAEVARREEEARKRAEEKRKAEEAKKVLKPRQTNSGFYWELHWSNGGELPHELKGGLFTSKELAEAHAEKYMKERGK